MDRHMDNKHPDRLNLDREAGDDGDGDGDDDADASPPPERCLGDLCPVLGCGEYDPGDCSVEISSGGAGAGVGAARGDGGEEGTIRRGCGMCDPVDMERRRHACLGLFGRYVGRTGV